VREQPVKGDRRNYKLYEGRDGHRQARQKNALRSGFKYVQEDESPPNNEDDAWRDERYTQSVFEVRSPEGSASFVGL
jgi:hypothetical protein